jgi:hypothetical protein
MKKRKPVPAALHSELTEYSSLLRALRTANTLDVVSHLPHPHPAVSTADDNDFDSDKDPESTSEHPANPQIHDTIPAVGQSTISTALGTRKSTTKHKRKSSASTSTNRTNKRDTWTRWPLLADDVHVPEWGLEDEINLIASHAIKRHPSSSGILLPGTNSRPDWGTSIEAESDTPSDESESPSYLSALALHTSNYLSQILALLAAYTPPREKSLQNRIEPISWENVLGVLGSESGLVDEKSVLFVSVCVLDILVMTIFRHDN